MSVSSIRDLGLDKDSISESKLGFTIRLDKHESMKITRNYHYSDWATVKIELEKERNDLLKQWSQLAKNP